MDKFKISDDLPYRAGILLLKAGEKQSLSTQYPAIVFVTETSIYITLEFSSGTKKITQGQLFLLPPGILCTISSKTDNSLLYLEVPDMGFLYMRYLSSPFRVKQMNAQELFSPLEIVGVIPDFIRCISFYLKDKMTSTTLMGLKSMELLSLLKHYYSVEELHHFFAPILSDDYKFALFVFTHYQHVSSVKELASLSNYSSTHFDRLFRRVFRQPPYQWILQKKIRSIYEEVKNTSKPLKVIADEYGFASVANFGDFCRKHFGEAPSQLRKK